MKKFFRLVLFVVFVLFSATGAMAGERWKTVTFDNYNCSYQLPESFMVMWHSKISPEHEMIASDVDATLMTGVILVDLDKTNDKKYIGFPRNIEKLNNAKKQELLKNLIDEIYSTDKNAVGLKGEIRKLNGNICVFIDGLSGSSRSLSYIFVKGSRYVCVDYIYSLSKETKAKPIVKKSINSFVIN